MLTLIRVNTKFMDSMDLLMRLDTRNDQIYEIVTCK